MSHLIIGGTGTVGSNVVAGLINKGEQVKVLTRSAEKAKALPNGAQAAVGDLTDPTTFDNVFSGSDRMFLLNAVSITELQEALAAVNEAQRRGYKRMVYLSIHNVERGPHIPMFATKIIAERVIKDSHIPYTFLRANNYFQNDLRIKDVILNYNVYPQPYGNVGLQSIDTRDVSEAAVNALTRDNFLEKTYNLIGPEVLTGQDCANIYGQLLGREIKCTGDDLESWYQQVRQFVPEWLAYDLRIMYHMFQEEGLIGNAVQLKETEAIVGHPPRRFEDFARELVGVNAKTPAQ